MKIKNIQEEISYEIEIEDDDIGGSYRREGCDQWYVRDGLRCERLQENDYLKLEQLFKDENEN